MQPIRTPFRVPLGPSLLIAMAVAFVVAVHDASGQTPATLVVSLAKDREVGSGRYLPFGQSDLLGFTPGASTEVYPLFSRGNLAVFAGDVNRNGAFDDAPLNIDAIALPAGSKRPSIYGAILSFSAASTALEGGTVLDGDLVQLVPGGGFTMFASEATLSSLTGTRTIDIDAATVTSSGELLFSFTEDDATDRRCERTGTVGERSPSSKRQTR